MDLTYLIIEDISIFKSLDTSEAAYEEGRGCHRSNQKSTHYPYTKTPWAEKVLVRGDTNQGVIVVRGVSPIQIKNPHITHIQNAMGRKNG